MCLLVFVQKKEIHSMLLGFCVESIDGVKWEAVCESYVDHNSKRILPVKFHNKPIRITDTTLRLYEWYVNGAQDSMGKPHPSAMFYQRPTPMKQTEWLNWRVGGVTHKLDGPAFSSFTWAKQGRIHRTDGPVKSKWVLEDGFVPRAVARWHGMAKVIVFDTHKPA